MGTERLTVTKIKGSSELLTKWHLICHLQRESSLGGDVFYRIFEYSAESREIAERRALQILHDFCKKLSSSKFTLIVVAEGGYPGISSKSLQSPNISVARPKFNDPKEILAEWDANNIFVRAKVCPISTANVM